MKIDYKKLEKEYMTSNISLSKLAEKHGIAKSAVSKYAKAHKWLETKNTREQKRTERTIERTIESQDDAWVKLKSTMCEVIQKQWQKVNEGDETINVGQLARATKDVREMGAFGTTMAEKKLIAEIDKLQKEINASETDKSITIRIEGAEDYGG